MALLITESIKMSTTLDLQKDLRDLKNELYYLNEDDDNYEKYKELLEQRQKQLKWSIEKTCMYYADLVIEQQLDADNAKTIADRTAKKARSAKNKTEWTKLILKELMFNSGITKLKTDYTNASIFQGQEYVNIPENFEASELPDKYRKDIPATSVPISRDITRALKAGEDICGLKLISKGTVIRFS